MVLAVFSGILAGLTPCIAALYPFILYKFARMEKRKLLYQYPLFLAGFLISFIGIGLFFNYVFSKDSFTLTPEIFALILASILLLISFSFHCYFSVAQNMTVATCNISCPICRRYNISVSENCTNTAEFEELCPLCCVS